MRNDFGLWELEGWGCHCLSEEEQGDCKDAHEFIKGLGSKSGIRKRTKKEEAEGGDLEPKGTCLQGKQRHQCVPCHERQS